jgi:hypothetical protein
MGNSLGVSSPSGACCRGAFLLPPRFVRSARVLHLEGPACAQTPVRSPDLAKKVGAEAPAFSAYFEAFSVRLRAPFPA